MSQGFQPVPHTLLHEQVSRVLIRLIESGEIPDVLPSERVLAQRLDISRPVLRQTLAMLHREGLVEISHGKRTRIIGKKRPRTTKRKTILVAGPMPTGSRALNLRLLEALRQRLEAKGYAWSMLFDQQLNSPRGTALLAERVKQTDPSCLLLTHSTEAMQHWAQTQRRASVIFGTAFPGVDLPSVDLDYHALGWHAAGQLIKAGHRSICLLFPKGSRRGDQASREGILDYLRSRPDLTVTVTSDEVNDITTEFQATVERTLARSKAPTAYLTFLPLHTLTLLTLLLRRGVRIPEDVAIISRDSEHYLEAMIPEPARYERSEITFVTQTIRMVEKVSSGIKPSRTHIRLIPNFHPGQTI